MDLQRGYGLTFLFWLGGYGSSTTLHRGGVPRALSAPEDGNCQWRWSSLLAENKCTVCNVLFPQALHFSFKIVQNCLANLGVNDEYPRFLICLRYFPVHSWLPSDMWMMNQVSILHIPQSSGTYITYIYIDIFVNIQHSNYCRSSSHGALSSKGLVKKWEPRIKQVPKHLCNWGYGC